MTKMLYKERRRHPPCESFLFPTITPLLLVGIAAAIEQAKRCKERCRRPPGQLVALRHDGRRVHVLYHAPEELADAPCVIMEAGANCWSPVWDEVAVRVGSIARVLRYDRAGFGFSEACDPRRPRSVMSVAEELRATLAAAGARPPYVLVAHSLGALYANELLRRLAPAELCGVVYVDAASPESVALLENVVPTASPPAWLARTLGALGLLRLLAPVALRPYADAFRRARLRGEAMATWARGDWLLAYTREWAAAMRGVKRADGAAPALAFPPGWLGEVPIAVLVPDVYQRTEGKGYIAQLQRLVAAYSTDAVVIAVEDCGHFVQLERPDVVAMAVESVIRRAEKRGRLRRGRSRALPGCVVDC